MAQEDTLTRAGLRTPKAAAVAGIVFSVLLIVIFGLVRMSVPGNPLEPGAWLATHSAPVAVALNLVPFAGISFLWFIGVLRDRLGAREDRFFATVFFGSALSFLGMLFAASAVVGAIVVTASVEPDEMINSVTFRFARTVAYNLMNVYAIKMAGVFMISTSTVALYTGIVPRCPISVANGTARLCLCCRGNYPLGRARCSHCRAQTGDVASFLWPRGQTVDRLCSIHPCRAGATIALAAGRR